MIDYDARMTPRVEILKLRPDAVVPRYMSALAAGLDLVAALDAPVTIEPGHRHAIDTGLAFALPPGFEGQLRPRSGLALKHGVTLVNAPGTLDADFRGSVKLIVINHGHADRATRDRARDPGRARGGRRAGVDRARRGRVRIDRPVIWLIASR